MWAIWQVMTIQLFRLEPLICLMPRMAKIGQFRFAILAISQRDAVGPCMFRVARRARRKLNSQSYQTESTDKVFGASILLEMLKRRYYATASDNIDIPSDSATVASDIASTLIVDVLESLEQTTGWKKMKVAVDGMILTLEECDRQKNVLKHRRPGGSKPGRTIIQRNFVLAFETLRMQYFSQNPVYSDIHFRRRFRFDPTDGHALRGNRFMNRPVLEILKMKPKICV